MEWILNERSGIYFKQRSEPCRSCCKQTIQQLSAATENRYKFARSLLVHMSILWRSERKERVNKIYLCTSNMSVMYVSYVCCVYLFLFHLVYDREAKVIATHIKLHSRYNVVCIVQMRLSNWYSFEIHMLQKCQLRLHEIIIYYLSVIIVLLSCI